MQSRIVRQPAEGGNIHNFTWPMRFAQPCFRRSAQWEREGSAERRGARTRDDRKMRRSSREEARKAIKRRKYKTGEISREGEKRSPRTGKMQTTRPRRRVIWRKGRKEKETRVSVCSKSPHTKKLFPCEEGTRLNSCREIHTRSRNFLAVFFAQYTARKSLQ